MSEDTAKIVMDLYETWKAFASKLEVHSQNILTATFRYFKQLKEFTAHHNVSAVNIEVYMRDLELEFSIRFQDFKHFGTIFSNQAGVDGYRRL